MSIRPRSSSTPSNRLVLTILLAQALVHTGAPLATAQQLTEARVIHVADGDSLVVLVNGRQERLRLIGIDAPEPGRGSDRAAQESLAFAQRWLSGRRAWLEHDAELRDRYCRRLAYVWLQPPAARTFVLMRTKMFNAVILVEGYARLLTIRPSVRYAEVFRSLEHEARAQGRGLWKTGLFLHDPGASVCDPSYPDARVGGTAR